MRVPSPVRAKPRSVTLLIYREDHSMNARRILLLAATGLFCFQAVGGAKADAPAGAVSGSGQEVIKRAPELLRMQIELSAKGKTLTEALKKLEARRESALGHLAKIGADRDSVKIGDVRMDASTSDRQRQMEMMVRQRMRQSGQKNKKTAEQPLTVSCSLASEWKLAGKTPEERLIEIHAIQEKAHAADLAGLKSEAKSPEEEELAEELGEDMASTVYFPNGGEDEAKPGEPIFLCVSKISAEDRSQALAAAFAKAREQAEELSKAAGAELGALQSLSEGGNFGNAAMAGYSDYYANARNQIVWRALAAQGAGAEPNSNEAIGAQPGDVSLSVSVTATFQLAGGK
jgi:uncharacterized protein YggE